jgi:hypothetical protein
VYGSLRFSAGIFYGRLGVAPEEVGLDYAEMIARSIYGLGLLLIIMAAVRFVVLPLGLALIFLVYRLIRPPRDAGRLEASGLSFKDGFRRGIRLSIDDWVFDLVVFVFILFPIIFAIFQGDEAANGRVLAG